MRRLAYAGRRANGTRHDWLNIRVAQPQNGCRMLPNGGKWGFLQQTSARDPPLSEVFCLGLQVGKFSPTLVRFHSGW